MCLTWRCSALSLLLLLLLSPDWWHSAAVDDSVPPPAVGGSRLKFLWLEKGVPGTVSGCCPVCRATNGLAALRKKGRMVKITTAGSTLLSNKSDSNYLYLNGNC